jgi:hypothetical protein
VTHAFHGCPILQVGATGIEEEEEEEEEYSRIWLEVLRKIWKRYSQDSWHPVRDSNATSAEDAAEMVPTRPQLSVAPVIRHATVELTLDSGLLGEEECLCPYHTQTYVFVARIYSTCMHYTVTEAGLPHVFSCPFSLHTVPFFQLSSLIFLDVFYLWSWLMTSSL